MQSRDDIYSRVTNQIIEAMEAGTPTFQMPWHSKDADCFAPANAVSKRAYRGINVLALWAAAIRKGYTSGLWATYEQWKQLGAQIRKGEKATEVVLWKPAERANKNSPKAADESESIDRQNAKSGLLARGYSVFNVAQVDGYIIEAIQQRPEHVRIAHAESTLTATGAIILHGGASAYYQPTTDSVHLPLFESFRDALAYYSTLAHELTHWTGAPSRLNRNLTIRFGTATYAAEELVAELGAAFLCASLGLSSEPRTDHVAYIHDWLSLLKKDKRAIFTAASKAQEAADFIFVLTSISYPLNHAVSAA